MMIVPAGVKVYLALGYTGMRKGMADGAQIDAAIFDLERLYLLGPMGVQPGLRVDAGEPRWELAQVRRRRSDQTGELAEAPMRGGDRCVGAGQY